MLKLSIIIPVYNEEKTILEVLERIEAVGISGLEKEVIIVDDGSVDNTKEILNKLENKYRIFYHLNNQGKGAALRTGFKEASGDFILIQDADLEYDPKEYFNLLEPIFQNKADIVYGSRNLKSNPRFRKSYYYGVKFISWLTNLLYGSDLTDVYTCYKVFRASVLEGLELASRGFEFEEEVTVKLLKKKHKILEVPISYYPRNFKQGKKIGAVDGIKAISTMVKYKFNE